MKVFLKCSENVLFINRGHCHVVWYWQRKEWASCCPNGQWWVSSLPWWGDHISHHRWQRWTPAETCRHMVRSTIGSRVCRPIHHCNPTKTHWDLFKAATMCCSAYQHNCCKENYPWTRLLRFFSQLCVEVGLKYFCYSQTWAISRGRYSNARQN